MYECGHEFILVVESSGFADTTLALFHPTTTNQSLTKVSNSGAKLQEGKKQSQLEAMTPNKVAIMIDLMAMHANNDSNMDTNNEYTHFYGHGYSYWAFLEI